LRSSPSLGRTNHPITQIFSDLKKAFSSSDPSNNKPHVVYYKAKERTKDIGVLTAMLAFVPLHVTTFTIWRQSTSDPQTTY
jgi:hypothetical protein